MTTIFLKKNSPSNFFLFQKKNNFGFIFSSSINLDFFLKQEKTISSFQIYRYYST